MKRHQLTEPQISIKIYIYFGNTDTLPVSISASFGLIICAHGAYLARAVIPNPSRYLLVVISCDESTMPCPRAARKGASTPLYLSEM